MDLPSLSDSSTTIDVAVAKKSNPIDITFTSVGLSSSFFFYFFLILLEKLKGKEKVILAGVTGEFYSGEVNAIMGPSGAGKTSFMNVISARVQNTTGKIYINGKEDSLSKYTKVMGYVPQEDVMLTDLTVREILNHSARMR